MSDDFFLSTESIVESRELVRTYQFELENIMVTITIRIYRKIGQDRFYFDQSHYIKTPCQLARYRTSSPYRDTEDEALGHALTTFTHYYHEAVQKGHMPDETWLVANKNF